VWPPSDIGTGRAIERCVFSDAIRDHLFNGAKESAMLVLTRKQQEQIHIGDDVTITILKIKGRAVRLGIEAPRELKVIRGELPPHPAADAATEVTEADMRPAASHTAGALRCGRHRGVDLREGTDPASTSAAALRKVPRSPLAPMIRSTLHAGPLAAVAE
jgi:carbon storage regulator CsrA